MAGNPCITVIRNTVMFSMVEMPRVIFSPDSAGMRKTNLKINSAEMRGKNNRLLNDDFLAFANLLCFEFHLEVQKTSKTLSSSLKTQAICLKDNLIHIVSTLRDCSLE